MDSFTGSFQGFDNFQEKQFEGTPLRDWISCFHNAILI